MGEYQNSCINNCDMQRVSGKLDPHRMDILSGPVIECMKLKKKMPILLFAAHCIRFGVRLVYIESQTHTRAAIYSAFSGIYKRSNAHPTYHVQCRLTESLQWIHSTRVFVPLRSFFCAWRATHLRLLVWRLSIVCVKIGSSEWNTCNKYV